MSSHVLVPQYFELPRAVPSASAPSSAPGSCWIVDHRPGECTGPRGSVRTNPGSGAAHSLDLEVAHNSMHENIQKNTHTFWRFHSFTYGHVGGGGAL